MYDIGPYIKFISICFTSTHIFCKLIPVMFRLAEIKIIAFDEIEINLD